MLENQIFIILAFFKRNEIFDIVHWSVLPSQMSVMTKQKMMNILITGLHSSRMRTVRSGSRLGGGCLRGEGGCLVPWGVCSWGVPGPGGSDPGGSLLLGGGIPACTDADPPVDRMTDTCKNISFATSLRTVINALGNNLRNPSSIACGWFVVPISGGYFSKFSNITSPSWRSDALTPLPSCPTLNCFEHSCK